MRKCKPSWRNLDNFETFNLNIKKKREINLSKLVNLFTRANN